MKRSGKVFIDTLKKSGAGIAAVVLSFLASATVFFLYNLPVEPFLYAAALVLFGGTFLFLITYSRELGKAGKRERMVREALMQTPLPPSGTLAEEDYGEAIRILRDELTKLRNEYAGARQEDIDYYTAWVHQIKTPIAVMRMQLGGREDESSRAMEAELFRIEQYVDMVLTYLRLGEDSTDLVIREYPLDEMIREAVRKFAPQFVAKKLRLRYEGTDAAIVTDKKWFSCILEQILSNAIKYTPSGEITVTVENDSLKITDTGIGIAPEDLPRIFEKGYTGENGRLEKRSSGLGLYLCKKSADLLRLPLSVESTVGRGSTFTVDLAGKERKPLTGTPFRD